MKERKPNAKEYSCIRALDVGARTIIQYFMVSRMSAFIRYDSVPSALYNSTKVSAPSRFADAIVVDFCV